MGFLAAFYSFLQSPLGIAFVVTPVVSWAMKQLAKQTNSARATALANYAYKACEAVESMHIGGAEKYEKALKMFKDSIKAAKLIKPRKDGSYGLSPSEAQLFEQLAKQFAMSKKPPPPRVNGKK